MSIIATIILLFLLYTWFTRRVPKHLQIELKRLLQGDMATANRLLKQVRSLHPHKPERWYYEKVIRDLVRDRRSY